MPNERRILFTIPVLKNPNMFESMAVSHSPIISNSLFEHLQVFGVTCNAQMVLILHFMRLESRFWLIKNLSYIFFFGRCCFLSREKALRILASK